MSADRKAALADLNHPDPLQQILALTFLKRESYLLSMRRQPLQP
jgi:hypothetical protein